MNPVKKEVFLKQSSGSTNWTSSKIDFLILEGSVTHSYILLNGSEVDTMVIVMVTMPNNALF